MSNSGGTRMDDFNINELMLFIVGVLGAFGGLCVIIQKSKCKKISICGMGCERDVAAIIAEERLEKTGHTGETPRRPSLAELNKEVKLELKKEALEPEVEKAD